MRTKPYSGVRAGKYRYYKHTICYSGVMYEEAGNYAFVDGQNLHLGTTKHPDEPWSVDLARLRVYLKEKYSVIKAFYYLGFVGESFNDLYEEIQSAGFILMFREHNPAMKSIKKGNVDTEIVFDCMRRIYKKEDFSKVVLVSGDGDYYRMVSFLREEGRLEKVLFPNHQASSLYNKKMRTHFCVNLSETDIRKKIMKDKKKRAT